MLCSCLYLQWRKAAKCEADSYLEREPRLATVGWQAGHSHSPAGMRYRAGRRQNKWKALLHSSQRISFSSSPERSLFIKRTVSKTISWFYLKCIHSAHIFVLIVFTPSKLKHLMCLCKFFSSSYHYRFTCWPAGLLALYVDLPDTTSLCCSEPVAAALSGPGSSLHQLQHKRPRLPEH